MKQLKLFIIVLILLFANIFWFCYWQLHRNVYLPHEIVFEIQKGEAIFSIADRLEEQGVIKNSFFFKKYATLKGIDKKINFGKFKFNSSLAIPDVAIKLTSPSISELTITILPGWDLRDIAEYFKKQNIISKASDFYKVSGMPAVFGEVQVFDFEILKDKPKNVSLEGYLSPNTYRIYDDAGLEDILKKLLQQTESELSAQIKSDINKSGNNIHQVLTIASILEKEVTGEQNKKMVADIFWRRYDAGWGLQADSTVHYVSGREGDIFTTKEERDVNNLWNTYKYAGLPPGPICNPSIESIIAAAYPEKNDYWYFFTTSDGKVVYSRTLNEHNAQVSKYLK
jgi:UPF0755 protein